jgi:hypothetical protein
MFKYLSFSIFILFSFFSNGQETTSIQKIEELKNGVALVRLYMNKPKVDMLQKTINDDKTDTNTKASLKRTLDAHIADRNNYKMKVIKAFTEKYNFSKVFFMYDYDQKKLKEGIKSGYFLDNNGEVDPSISIENKSFLIFGRGNNDETVVISQLSGEPLPKGFPVDYKPSILGIFNAVFPKDKLGNYISKLNKKLKNFYMDGYKFE